MKSYHVIFTILFLFILGFALWKGECEPDFCLKCPACPEPNRTNVIPDRNNMPDDNAGTEIQDPCIVIIRFYYNGSGKAKRFLPEWRKMKNAFKNNFNIRCESIETDEPTCITFSLPNKPETAISNCDETGEELTNILLKATDTVEKLYFQDQIK